MLRLARRLPRSRVYMQGVGRRETSIDPVHIDNSCERFKAELGKNRRVLCLNLGAVDNISRRKKRVYEMQINGMTQGQARRGRGAFCKASNVLDCFPIAPAMPIMSRQCWLA